MSICWYVCTDRFCNVMTSLGSRWLPVKLYGLSQNGNYEISDGQGVRTGCDIWSRHIARALEENLLGPDRDARQHTTYTGAVRRGLPIVTKHRSWHFSTSTHAFRKKNFYPREPSAQTSHKGNEQSDPEPFWICRSEQRRRSFLTRRHEVRNVSTRHVYGCGNLKGKERLMVASCGVTKKGRVKDVHRTFGGGDVVIKLLVEKTSVNIHLQTWCLSHVVIVRHRYRYRWASTASQCSSNADRWLYTSRKSYSVE